MENIRLPSNGIVIFACAGAGDFFETFSLDAPVEEHKLYVYRQPHLYPLARQCDEFPRYAALIADEDAARIYVFGIGEQPGESNIKETNNSQSRIRFDFHGRTAATTRRTAARPARVEL